MRHRRVTTGGFHAATRQRDRANDVVMRMGNAPVVMKRPTRAFASFAVSPTRDFTVTQHTRMRVAR